MTDFTSNNDQPAVHATNTATGAAIFADGTSGGGLAATSVSDVGVHSANHSASEAAIFGINDTPGQQVPDGGKAGAGSGVWGHTRVEKGAGVVGSVEPGLGQAAGVVGIGPTAGRFFGDVEVTGLLVCQGQSLGNPPAVKGISDRGDAVQGICSAPGRSGLTGIHEGGGRGLTAVGSPAGHFDGDVEVIGRVRVSDDLFLRNGDVTERFEVNATADYRPGMLMVIGGNGALEPCTYAYDRRVIGVISGAGTHRPAITLAASEAEATTVPIALVGTVCCLVDADLGPVKAGDLVTSSETPGHAMRATDPMKSFGAIVGKALAPLAEGRAIVPIVISLQ